MWAYYKNPGDIGVRIRKEGGGRDACGACQLWLSEGRPCLDRQVETVVNP